MASHISDINKTAFETYNQSGSQKSFSDWLKEKRGQVDQKKAKYYYNKLDDLFNRFDDLYQYLETISNKYGYKTNNALDILSDIKARLKYISDLTGIQDMEFLNQLFQIDKIAEVCQELAQIGGECYIFGGEALTNISNYQQISELIGVQVSAGRNKATLETFLLDGKNSAEFMSAAQQKDFLTLIPVRDASGKINDFSFGVNTKNRGNALEIFKNELGLTGELLPINYEDPRATEIVNAVIQGKKVTIQGNEYDFANKETHANFGQKGEGLTSAIYDWYAAQQTPLSGTVLEEIVLNQLVNSNGKFQIPAGISGLASPDFMMQRLVNGQIENIPVQNKNIGPSHRFTFGGLKGEQEVMGFYIGVGSFNQTAEKQLKDNYGTMVQLEQQDVSMITNQANIELWNSIIGGLQGQGINVGGASYIGEDDSAIISSEAIVSLIMGALESY